MSVRVLLEWADDEGGLQNLWSKHGDSFEEVIYNLSLDGLGWLTDEEENLMESLSGAYAIVQNLEDQLYSLDAEEQRLLDYDDVLRFDCE